MQISQSPRALSLDVQPGGGEGGGGGGVSTREESLLIITGDVEISGCHAPKGIGGGLLSAGASLDVNMQEHTLLTVYDNKAKRGAGLAAMGAVSFRGPARSMIRGNIADDRGGGLYAFSRDASINVLSEHTLMIEDNSAIHDGGGVFLAQAARFSVVPPECSPGCSASQRGNGHCDMSCMVAGRLSMGNTENSPRKRVFISDCH